MRASLSLCQKQLKPAIMETKRTNTEAAVEIQLDGRVNENAFVENANENQTTSKSGMVTRSGFKKRSKNKSYLSGSMSVIPMA